MTQANETKPGPKWPDDYDAETVAMSGGTGLPAMEWARHNAASSASEVTFRAPTDRDTLGRIVREAWVRWARGQAEPKASWLAPYDELSEAEKEADRQIGRAVAKWLLDNIVPATPAAPDPQSESDLHIEAAKALAAHPDHPTKPVLSPDAMSKTYPSKTTDAVTILHRRYGVPSVEVRAEAAADDAEELRRHLASPGVCGRCGGTWPTCCSCPDVSHWNRGTVVPATPAPTPAVLVALARFHKREGKIEGFKTGAVAMREMLARFVEQGGLPEIAQSLRLNWNPEWGVDPERPAKPAPAAPDPQADADAIDPETRMSARQAAEYAENNWSLARDVETVLDDAAAFGVAWGDARAVLPLSDDDLRASWTLSRYHARKSAEAVALRGEVGRLKKYTHFVKSCILSGETPHDYAAFCATLAAALAPNPGGRDAHT